MKLVLEIAVALMPIFRGSMTETSTTDDPLFELPPYPPRLERTTHFRDWCWRLCIGFMADNRGDGFDLCDASRMSFCRASLVHDDVEICENLYWARTGADEPGLVYSVEGSDLTEDERQHPLSCDDAARILGQDV